MKYSLLEAAYTAAITQAWQEIQVPTIDTSANNY